MVDLAEKIAKRAPRVAGMTISALRQAFRLAIERRRLEGLNPCSGVKTGQSRARDRALDERELTALLEWLPGASLSANVRDALRLQLLTGTRSGEVVGAEWSEIDLEAAVWTQPAAKTKNGREHRVMLSPRAVELLKGRQDLNARWVFPSRGDRPRLPPSMGAKA